MIEPGARGGDERWALDHVLLTAHDLARSVVFYELLLDATATRFEITPSTDSPRSTTDFAHFMGSDGTSLHLATPTPNFHVLYPELPIAATRPHVAVTVEDLGLRQARLEARGWGMMPPKAWGPTGFVRLYTDEPAATLVEINQRVGDSPPVQRGTWRLDHVGLEAYDLEASRGWFSDVLGVPVADGPVEDGQGHRLTLRRPDPGRWRDAARHLGVAVPDLAEAAARLDAEGIAYQRAEDGSLALADPSANAVHVVADGAAAA